MDIQIYIKWAIMLQIKMQNSFLNLNLVNKENINVA